MTIGCDSLFLDRSNILADSPKDGGAVLIGQRSCPAGRWGAGALDFPAARTAVLGDRAFRIVPQPSHGRVPPMTLGNLRELGVQRSSPRIHAVLAADHTFAVRHRDHRELSRDMHDPWHPIGSSRGHAERTPAPVAIASADEAGRAASARANGRTSRTRIDNHGRSALRQLAISA